MAKKNYYGVKNGRKTGVFSSWGECKKQVSGFSHAEYKGFSTENEAYIYVYGYAKQSTIEEFVLDTNDNHENRIAIYVDGSFDKDRRIYGSSWVIINGADVIEQNFKAGNNERLAKHWNITGELLAVIYALRRAKSCGYSKIDIYYDCEGIRQWATGEYKCNIDLTKKYRELFLTEFAELDIIFHKVKAHTGNKYNEIADGLAKRSIKEFGMSMKN